MSTVRYLRPHTQTKTPLNIRSLKVLSNNDIDPALKISKDEFMEAGETTRDFLGSEFDMEKIFEKDQQLPCKKSHNHILEGFLWFT